MGLAPSEDGLALLEVGRWVKQKHHFIGRYLEAFTAAMREKWSEIHYVDLFAGAGFARNRDSAEVIAGSPILAATTKYPFTQLHLIERDAKNFEALRSRLERCCLLRSPQIIHGDTNERASEVFDTIPSRRTLTVTFADPYGLHFDFDTAKIVASRRSDLIVLLADNMDALRNWSAYYENNPDSSLDRFMGEPGWREDFRRTVGVDRAEVMRNRYQKQLETLGYEYFAFERIHNDQARDIYLLLYASRHKAGIKIWKGISSIDPSGQHRLGF